MLINKNTPHEYPSLAGETYLGMVFSFGVLNQSGAKENLHRWQRTTVFNDYQEFDTGALNYRCWQTSPVLPIRNLETFPDSNFIHCKKCWLRTLAIFLIRNSYFGHFVNTTWNICHQNYPSIGIGGLFSGGCLHKSFYTCRIMKLWAVDGHEHREPDLTVNTA